MQHDNRFVDIEVSSPTPNQPIPAASFPFPVVGTATPQPPATAVTTMGYDVDNGPILQVIPTPPSPVPVPAAPPKAPGGKRAATPEASKNAWTFNFRMANPGLGKHILTIHVFDDQGDLTEKEIPFGVV